MAGRTVECHTPGFVPGEGLAPGTEHDGADCVQYSEEFGPSGPRVLFDGDSIRSDTHDSTYACYDLDYIPYKKGLLGR